MGVFEQAGLAFAALVGLMMLGLPIAFAMLAVGIGGLILTVGERAAFGMVGQVPFTATMSYELSVVPMFLLMGAMPSCKHGGQQWKAYDGARAAKAATALGFVAPFASSRRLGVLHRSLLSFHI
jgi:hypothetical protein